MTPEELRAKAAQNEQEAADSFERCDTDGFLSQWASGITARKLRAQADLAENDGMVETSALFNLDGTIASTHKGYGDWGPYWVLNDEATKRFGKRFVSPSKAQNPETRRKNNAKKGFTIGTIRVKGYVDIVASGTGLSGAANAYVATLPVISALRAGEYSIVSTDNDTE